jgi:hypothetical protein
MKYLILAFVFLVVLVQSFNVHADTCTHDLEVLCIDDINKGNHQHNISLHALRKSRLGEGQRCPN